MANNYRWSFYLDSRGNWRWRRNSSSVQSLAYSESFESKADCIANAKRFGYVDEEAASLSNDPFADVRRPEPDER